MVVASETSKGLIFCCLQIPATNVESNN